MLCSVQSFSVSFFLPLTHTSERGSAHKNILKKDKKGETILGINLTPPPHKNNALNLLLYFPLAEIPMWLLT